MTSYLNHTISYGDTLQSIAQHRLGNAQRWVEIAMLNDLVYPFLTNNPEDKVIGVLTVGDNLVVPVSGEHIEVITRSEATDIYEKALGQDLDIFGEDGPITLTNSEIGEFTSDVYGDANVVKGLKNFRQAILMRLATPEGSLLHHPNYGSRLHELIGKKSGAGTLQKIKIEVERVIRSDGRTKDIKFELFQMVEDRIHIKLSIEPVGFDVAFMLSLALGEGGVIEWA